MPDIMVNCPATGKPINTGITLSKELFETAVMQGNLIQCPHCRQVHPWDKKDAYLQEEKAKG
jgi:endogenous inhibitor of DNA gyrase (YacG/DUF329 family)